MRTRIVLSTIAMFTACAAALAEPAVTLSLESSKDGHTVVAGATIDWRITVSVSTGDNAGLALICVDLIQKATNPAFMDIPPADEASIDETMQNFSRPAGISNPGEGGAETGYIGVQRGEPGKQDLVQIGGAQNTFGHAGSGMGTSVDVLAGVGQGTEPQVVVSGELTALDKPGVYVCELKNAIANVLEKVYPPPAFSPVSPAAVGFAAASITFTVSSYEAGDVNCDGKINAFDIDPFVLALIDPAGYELAYPDCDLTLADINQDGKIDAFDIDPFVDLLTGD